MLPACVDDYVGPDHVVRFIEAFVESLDHAAAGFERVRPKATGKPGYDPSYLLNLYIYGYLNRVRPQSVPGGRDAPKTESRIANVRGEFSLTALAYNIRRALTLVGVAGLMQAISA